MSISSQPNIVPNKFSDDFYTGVGKDPDTLSVCTESVNVIRHVHYNQSRQVEQNQTHQYI